MEERLTPETHTVRMGEMHVTSNGTIVKTILGSCIGLVLHDKQRKLTAIAHIVLPTRFRGDPIVGKYADTAVPALLQELLSLGSRREDIRAYFAGGANMFVLSEDRKLATVGELNIAATRAQLKGNGIIVEFEDVGGNHGRSLLFSNQESSIRVGTIKPFGARLSRELST